MRYMDRLNGTTRTNAPIVKVAVIDSRQAANRTAEARRVMDYVESDSFSYYRGLMSNASRVGVCG